MGGSNKENPEPGSVVSAAVDPVPGTGSSLAQSSLRGFRPALLIWKPDSMIVGAPLQIFQRGEAGVGTFWYLQLWGSSSRPGFRLSPGGSVSPGPVLQPANLHTHARTHFSFIKIRN